MIHVERAAATCGGWLAAIVLPIVGTIVAYLFDIPRGASPDRSTP